MESLVYNLQQYINIEFDSVDTRVLELLYQLTN